MRTARGAAEALVGQRGGAERRAGVVGHRLHPDLAERGARGDLVVGDAVQGHPAGQAQPRHGLAATRVDQGEQAVGEVDHDVLGDDLQRGRDEASS